MRRKGFTLPIAALAVGLVMAGCGSGGSGSPSTAAGKDGSSAPTKQATGTPWTIGQVGSFSGLAASTMGETEPGLAAWAKWTNDHGGISNHPINLVQVDDAADPAKSTAAVKQLITADHVIAIVDDSLVDPVWESYVEQQGVPVIGSILFNTSFGTNPMFFPSGGTFPGLLYGMLAEAHKQGATSFAMASEGTTPSSLSTIQWFQNNADKAGLGYGKPLIVTIPYASPNYTAQCLAIKNANIGAMYSGTATAYALRFFKDCNTQHVPAKKVAVTYEVNSDWLKSSDVDGTTVVSPVAALSSNLQTINDFKQAMQTYQPKVAYGGEAQIAWAAGQLFAAAAKAGNLGDNPTAADVLTGLYALKGETLGGLTPPLTFTKGQPNQVPCWFTSTISKGTYKVTNDNPTCQAPNLQLTPYS